MTFSILGGCILFFLLNLGAGLSSGGSGFEGFFFSFALIPSAGRPHTWTTSLFMHAGLFHLLGNMIYLYLFGACVEEILGRGKFVGFYLLGGVLGSLAHVLLDPMGFRSTTPLVGASGAISACMGAFAAHVGGFLCGALVGAILRARGWRSEEEVAKAMDAEIANSAPTPRPVIVWTGGQQAGPFAVPNALTMRENGTLGPDAFFWDEEANTWRPMPELQ